jgi:hypothetical protein
MDCQFAFHVLYILLTRNSVKRNLDPPNRHDSRKYSGLTIATFRKFFLTSQVQMPTQQSLRIAMQDVVARLVGDASE